MSRGGGIGSATLEAMIQAGLSPEQMLAIVRGMEADAAPKDRTAAERQQRHRDKLKAEADVTRDVTRDDVTDGPFLDKETSPRPPKEINPSPCVDNPRARSRFPTPEGVTDEQFRAFRQQRKKTLTDRAYTLLCNKLKALAEAGWPPGEMIDLAIERGWETVFEPKEGGNGSGRTNGMGRNQSSDGLSTTARAALRAFGDCDEPPRPGH